MHVVPSRRTPLQERDREHPNDERPAASLALVLDIDVLLRELFYVLLDLSQLRLVHLLPVRSSGKRLNGE